MDFETFEKAYTTSEMIKILNVSSATLRRWSLELEKSGYVFIKSKHNQKRLFVDRDIEMFKFFQQMVQDNNINIENASKFAVERFPNEVITKQADSAYPQEQIEQRSINDIYDYIEEQKKHNEEQKKFNEELLQIIQQQQKYIDEKLEKRDQVLVESLRAIQKEKQEDRQLLLEIATAKEQDEKKQGFWSKLFKSNK